MRYDEGVKSTFNVLEILQIDIFLFKIHFKYLIFGKYIFGIIIEVI
jgi:hypothetical protein